MSKRANDDIVIEADAPLRLLLIVAILVAAITAVAGAVACVQLSRLQSQLLALQNATEAAAPIAMDVIESFRKRHV